jgi:hypothetical protein
VNRERPPLWTGLAAAAAAAAPAATVATTAAAVLAAVPRRGHGWRRHCGHSGRGRRGGCRPYGPRPRGARPDRDLGGGALPGRERDSLLSSGTGANGELSAALAAVDDCANLTGSIGELTQIRDQRRSEYEQARAVSVSLLAGAGRLKLDLTRALSYSLRADDAYLGWATR